MSPSTPGLTSVVTLTHARVIFGAPSPERGAAAGHRLQGRKWEPRGGETGQARPRPSGPERQPQQDDGHPRGRSETDTARPRGPLPTRLHPLPARVEPPLRGPLQNTRAAPFRHVKVPSVVERTGGCHRLEEVNTTQNPQKLLNPVIVPGEQGQRVNKWVWPYPNTALRGPRAGSGL